jgi:anti-sigma B factor antagonist
MALSTSTWDDDGTYVLGLIGELDLATKDIVRQAIIQAVESGAAGVSVDLAGLEFIDSTGIGALVFGKRAADEYGVPFQVVNPKGPVDAVLTLTQVMGYLNATPPAG